MLGLQAVIEIKCFNYRVTRKLLKLRLCWSDWLTRKKSQKIIEVCYFSIAKLFWQEASRRRGKRGPPYLFLCQWCPSSSLAVHKLAVGFNTECIRDFNLDKSSEMINLCHFWPHFLRTTIFVVARSLPQICSSLKPNQHKQDKLVNPKPWYTL